MQDADEMTCVERRRARLKALSVLLKMPVISLVAGWRAERSVDLDEAALRAFLHVLDAELETSSVQDGPEEIGLFLVGRAGYPGFAEGVIRALRGRGIRCAAIIPDRVDGAFSLAALGADSRLMHPYAALGAYDLAPRRSTRPERDALFAQNLLARFIDEDFFDAAGRQNIADPARLVGRVARSLGAELLGDELGLSALELERVGVGVKLASKKEGEVLRALFQEYERALGALARPTPRYIASDIADEVEFSPAEELVGALLEGAAATLTFKLDTGRPDPDSGLLDGAWEWPESLF